MMPASMAAELAALPADWQALLLPIFNSARHVKLWQALAQEEQQQSVLPPAGKRLNAFALCPLAGLQVVIIGQDPYHGPHQAEGLSFSVSADLPIPPSLRNVYQALVFDGWQPPSSGSLAGWAAQGVLLLNQVLTVRQSQANSHAHLGWQALIAEVIAALQDRPAHAYVLWGAHAQKLAPLIEAKHLLLTGVHPSPLSAYRGFKEQRHFQQLAAWLQAQGLPGVDWSASG